MFFIRLLEYAHGHTAAFQIRHPPRFVLFVLGGEFRQHTADHDAKQDKVIRHAAGLDFAFERRDAERTAMRHVLVQ